MKVFRLTLCVLFVLSIIFCFGCEKVQDMGVLDDIVKPPDTDTLPTLKVGVFRPDPLYISFVEGAELAQAEINAAGGVLGMPVEFVYKEESPKDIVQSTTELIENENVVGILGPLSSTHAVKVGPVATVPVLSGATGAHVTETGDFIFLVANSNRLQAELVAHFIASTLVRDASLIWQNEDAFSVSFAEVFERHFSGLKLFLGDLVDGETGEILVADVVESARIVTKKVYEKGDTMFEKQLSAIKHRHWAILVIAGYPPELPLIVKQAIDMDFKVLFVGGDSWEDPLIFESLANNSSLPSAYYLTNFDPNASDFISAYEAMFGKPANGIAASGYDAMKLLALAIEKEQSTDPVAIREAIATTRNYQGATRIYYFTPDRHPLKNMTIYQIIDGHSIFHSVIGSVYPDDWEPFWWLFKPNTTDEVIPVIPTVD